MYSDNCPVGRGQSSLQTMLLSDYLYPLNSVMLNRCKTIVRFKPVPVPARTSWTTAPGSRKQCYWVLYMPLVPVRIRNLYGKKVTQVSYVHFRIWSHVGFNEHKFNILGQGKGDYTRGNTFHLGFQSLFYYMKDHNPAGNITWWREKNLASQ